ncbi:unnamed protein product, partial [Tilletia controversa]
MASTSRSSALDVNAVPSLRAFYLGPRGTYSHSVARAVFDPDSASVSPRRRGTGAGGEVELVPCVTITSVLRAAFDAVSKPKAKAKPGEVNGAGVGVANGDGLVEDGSASSLPGSSIAGGSADVEGVRCAYAVLPIENSTFGPVHETLDALRHAGISLDPSARPAPTSNADADALIKGEYRLPVSHTLLAGRATKERLRQLARWGKAGAATGVRVGEQNGHRPEAGRETTIEEGGINGRPGTDTDADADTDADTDADASGGPIELGEKLDGELELELELEELRCLGQVISHEQ